MGIIKRPAVTKPADRAVLMRKVAAINYGSPVVEMARDVLNAAAQFDFFVGLITDLEGYTMPTGDGVVNLSVREPFGFDGNVVAYNRPLMFTSAKSVALLAAGNLGVMKPPYQALILSYRLMELIGRVFPSDIPNIVTGGTECGQSLGSTLRLYLYGFIHDEVVAVILKKSRTTNQAFPRAKEPPWVPPSSTVQRAEIAMRPLKSTTWQ